MSDNQFLRWEDFSEDAKTSLFQVWTRGRELHWARKSWEALQKQGLTTYSDEIEKTRVLVRLMTLGTVYREFSGLAWDEYCEPQYSDWASDLQLSPFRVAQCIGVEFARVYDDDEAGLLRSALNELVDGARSEVYEALIAEFGDDSMLLVSLWNTVDCRRVEDEGVEDEDIKEGVAEKEDTQQKQQEEPSANTEPGGDGKAKSEINWLEDADIILNHVTPEKLKVLDWIQEGMNSVY